MHEVEMGDTDDVTLASHSLPSILRNVPQINRCSFSGKALKRFDNTLANPLPSPSDGAISREDRFADTRPLHTPDFINLLKQEAEGTRSLRAAVDELTHTREQRFLHISQSIVMQKDELFTLHQRLSELALQLQEEQERSARLMHENLELSLQCAEQQEQLSAAVELVRARGSALSQKSQCKPQQISLRNDGCLGRAGVRNTSRSGRGLSSSFVHTTMRRFEDSTLENAKSPSQSTFSLRALTTCKGGLQESATSYNHTLPRPGAPSPVSWLGPHPVELRSSVVTSSAPPGSLASVTVSGGNGNLSGETYNFNDTAAIAPSGKECHVKTDNAGDDIELLLALNCSKNNGVTKLAGLTEEVRILRQLIDEQRCFYERERESYLQECRALHEANLEETQNYLDTINHLEELHECCLRDLATYRHHAGAQIRDLKSEVHWLRHSMHETLLIAESSRQKEKDLLHRKIQRVETWYGPTVRMLSLDLEAHRRSTLTERKMQEQALREKDELIDKLKKTVKQQKMLLERAEERHRLEMEGVRSDLDLMRQSLRQMEKKIFFQRALEKVDEIV